MIPDETNPTQTTPEEPLAPTPVRALETTAPAEPQGDVSVTPPHGDPLGFAAFDAPPAAAEPPVLPTEEAPSAEVSFTPPHGDPLAETAFDALPPTANAPMLFAPSEPLDAASFTPPHGDPLGHEVPAPATPAAAASVISDPPSAPTPSDSAPLSAFTPEPPAESASPAPDLLYSDPVDPAPTGSLFPELEPVGERVESPFVEAVAVDGAVPGVDEPTASPAPEQPELPFAEPVEPVPASRYFSDPLEAGEPTEATVAGGDPLAYPNAEVHDDLEAAALIPEAVALEPELPAEHEVPMDGGPNWMLAFICAWSSAISLREAWFTLGGAGLGMILRNLGVLGYLLLGVGLLAFAFDALRWGRPRRGVGALVIPTLLTLAGVVCLVLWNDRGRPI